MYGIPDFDATVPSRTSGYVAFASRDCRDAAERGGSSSPASRILTTVVTSHVSLAATHSKNAGAAGTTWRWKLYSDAHTGSTSNATPP